MSRVRVPFPAPFSGYAADVAQSVERVLGKDEVTSSILVIGSRYSRCYNFIAGTKLGHDTSLASRAVSTREISRIETGPACHATRFTLHATVAAGKTTQRPRTGVHILAEYSTRNTAGSAANTPLIERPAESLRDRHTRVNRSVAQLVEHWSPKPAVAGSSPARPGFFQSR